MRWHHASSLLVPSLCASPPPLTVAAVHEAAPRLVGAAEEVEAGQPAATATLLARACAAALAAEVAEEVVVDGWVVDVEDDFDPPRLSRKMLPTTTTAITATMMTRRVWVFLLACFISCSRRCSRPARCLALLSVGTAAMLAGRRSRATSAGSGSFEGRGTHRPEVRRHLRRRRRSHPRCRGPHRTDAPSGR